jgi:hypothetical protein
MKEKLNYVFGSAAVVLLIVVFWFFSNPRRTQQVQAGFLGLDSPVPKAGLVRSALLRYEKGGLKRLDDLEAEVKRSALSNKELSATNQALREWRRTTTSCATRSVIENGRASC